MTIKHTNITVRVPAQLATDLRKLAKLEETRTGLRVDLSSIVRRALQQALDADRGAK